MRRFLLLYILAAAFSLSACHTPREIARDSTIIETRIERIFVHDTLLFSIPHQIVTIATRDTSSHLENDYATSDAAITPDGLLLHTLSTKPQNVQVPFDKPIERKDSIVYRDKEVQITQEVPYIPKFYKVCTILFWLIIAFAIIALAIRIYFKLHKI